MLVAGQCVKACIGKNRMVPCPQGKSSGAFASRIADTEKVPLAPAFIQWVRGVAAANNLTEDDVWARWQNYSRLCDIYDQSALTSEFIEAQKLKGEGIRGSLL
jgi:hypothetical protein